MSRGAIHLCFFLSGFSGLVSEVVWSRLLSYTLGSSHLSIALVVSTFMAGLALGSRLGGPLADRSPSPLRLYAWLVLAAGVTSALVPFILMLLDPLLGVVYRWNDGNPGHPLFAVFRIAACGGTILVPTVLMGATLPALVRQVTRDTDQVGQSLGTLYGVNSIGAVAGTAAAGFWLVRHLGLDGTIAVGAGLDIAIGAFVLLRTRGARALGPEGLRPARPDHVGPRVPLPGIVRLAVWSFGIAGFVNMCLQLGWTRALVLAIGNSTYAFSLILGTFILGLALGGAIGGLFADRIQNPTRFFGGLLVATALTAALTIPWLGIGPAHFAVRLADLGAHLGDFSYGRFLRAAFTSEVLVILPATILMGIALPVVGRLRVQNRDEVGNAVGAAYAANTVGAIAGTAVAGFVLIPLFDRVWGILYFAVAIGLTTGLVLWWRSPGATPRRAAILATIAVISLAVGYGTRPRGVLDEPDSDRIFWHPVVHSLGGYLNASGASSYDGARAYARAMIDTFESIYYSDGGLASVGVIEHRRTGRLSLNISGKPDASDGEDSTDRPTQLLLGHLPALLHPAPEKALNLGLGGGMTLGALAAHPGIERIDLLELIPEVEEAARLHFQGANDESLEDERVDRIIGDGRNHITHTGRTYDIITSEPSNFWIAGLGSLFTEEFYRLCLDRLEPGGIFCQWVYAYNIRDEDYRTALRTFLSVFPNTLVFSSYWGDTLLIGSREPVAIDAGRLRDALAVPAVRDDLAALGIAAPEDLCRYLQGTGASIAPWVGDGPHHRDLSPILEYTAPLGFYDPDRDLYSRLQEASGSAFPAVELRGFDEAMRERADLRRRGGRALRAFQLELSRGRITEALSAYERLVGVGDRWSLATAADDLLKARARLTRRLPDTLDRFRAIHDTPELFLVSGRRAAHPDGTRALVGPFTRAAEAAGPEEPQAHLALGIVLAQTGRSDEALAALDEARARGAPESEVIGLRAVVLGSGGDLPGAEAELRRAIEITPPDQRGNLAEHWYNLGFCLAQQGRPIEAALPYLQALRYGYPRDPAGGQLARSFQALEVATGPVRAELERVLGTPGAPKDAAAVRSTLESLARALTAMGREDLAAPLRESAASIAPR